MYEKMGFVDSANGMILDKRFFKWLPSYISAGITCDLNGENVIFKTEKSNIVRKESDAYKGTWYWSAGDKDQGV